MTTNLKAYDFDASKDRIQEYVNGSFQYEEVKVIPSRDKLTYSNGYYVTQTCSLFIDIRNSSSLPSLYKRNVLSRIYRAYISEAVAIINSNSNFAEISIHGDAVWGVSNAQYKVQLDSVLETAGQLSSMVDYLNCKLRKRGVSEIKVGIGMDFGRLLMIQAGFSGSGINDVVWMGDVVNQGSKLCGYGSKSSGDKRMMASKDFVNNLSNQKYIDFFNYNEDRECFHADIFYVMMNDDLNDNGC